MLTDEVKELRRLIRTQPKFAKGYKIVDPKIQAKLGAYAHQKGVTEAGRQLSMGGETLRKYMAAGVPKAVVAARPKKKSKPRSNGNGHTRSNLMPVEVVNQPPTQHITATGGGITMMRLTGLTPEQAGDLMRRFN